MHDAAAGAPNAVLSCAGRGNRHACRARVAQMQALPDGSTMARGADASLQSRCDGWGVAGAVGNAHVGAVLLIATLVRSSNRGKGILASWEQS
eukprot:4723322-Prymnesium_polylepis.1